MLARNVVHWPAGVLGFVGVLPDGTLVGNTKQSLELTTPGQATGRTIYRYTKASDFSFVQEVAETGGYLVFRVSYSDTSNADWAMVEVNIATGASHIIGRPEPGIGDDLMSIAPTAGDGYAAWSQARADNSLEVQITDVATGVTRRVPWRNIAFPHIVDGVLLAVAHPSGHWQEPSGDYVVAFDLHTLAQVPLPAGLSGVSEPRNLEVTPAGVLWSTTDFTTIHAISATNPNLLLTANGSQAGPSNEDWPYLSDNGFASWYQNGGGDGSGVFADLQTGVAVPLANQIYIAGNTVVAETYHGNTVIDSVFSTANLPRLTGCTPTPTAAPLSATPAPPLTPLSVGSAGQTPPFPRAGSSTPTT